MELMNGRRVAGFRDNGTALARRAVVVGGDNGGAARFTTGGTHEAMSAAAASLEKGVNSIAFASEPKSTASQESI